jgi:hypothetical protein
MYPTTEVSSELHPAYNSSPGPRRKQQVLYCCCRDVFTAPLRSRKHFFNCSSIIIQVLLRICCLAKAVVLLLVSRSWPGNGSIRHNIYVYILIHIYTKTDPVSEMSHFYSQEHRMMEKVQTPVLQSATHHRQNPIKSTILAIHDSCSYVRFSSVGFNSKRVIS